VFAFDGDAAGVKAAERAWEAAVELAARARAPRAVRTAHRPP
jgi:DNA primase